MPAYARRPWGGVPQSDALPLVRWNRGPRRPKLQSALHLRWGENHAIML
jgi:hypothetical protein